MKKKVIIFLVAVVIMFLGLIGVNKIRQKFIQLNSRYEITYNDGGEPGRDYCFFIDNDYQIYANETQYSSLLNSIPKKKSYEIKLSENSKKYLEDILGNLTVYKENVGSARGILGFKVKEKTNYKTYLIEYGSKEYIIFKYIFVYGREINEEVVEEILNDKSGTKII